MSPLLFVFIISFGQVLCGPTIRHNYNSTTCDDFQASFDISKITGPWYVVAILPDKLFPDRDVNCYRVELTESDGASLRWLAKKTNTPKEVLSKLERINGTTIRQRYQTEQPFDVWSKSVQGVNGCFQQVMSLDVGASTQKAVTHDAMMQLHLLEGDKKSGPYLVQMLWGRLISVVVYRRNQGVTQEQLKPIFELVSKLRGPQRLPKICNNPLRDLLFF